MSQNIIRFFNDFAATFPSDKSAEKAAFEQNIAQVFAEDLAKLATRYAVIDGEKPDIGDIIIWDENGTKKCGVVVTNKKVRILDGGFPLEDILEAILNKILAILKPTKLLQAQNQVGTILPPKPIISKKLGYEVYFKNNPTAQNSAPQQGNIMLIDMRIILRPSTGFKEASTEADMEIGR
jgi:hypothetical protein